MWRYSCLKNVDIYKEHIQGTKGILGARSCMLRPIRQPEENEPSKAHN